VERIILPEERTKEGRYPIMANIGGKYNKKNQARVKRKNRGFEALRG